MIRHLGLPIAAALLATLSAGSSAQQPDSTVVSGLLNRGKPVVGASPVEFDRRPLPVRLLDYGAPKERESAAWFLFGGATASDFPQLETVACDQIGLTGCSVDRFSFGPEVGALFRPFARLPIGFGVRGGRSRVSVTQRFNVSRLPEVSVTDLDVWTATAFADGWWRVSGRTRLVASMGWVWSWNRSTVESTFSGDRTIVEQRNQNGGRYTLGGGVEHDLVGPLTLRADYRFIDGDAGDADRQHQIGLLFAFALPGGATTRTARPGQSWRPAYTPDPPLPTTVVPRVIGLPFRDARRRLMDDGFAARSNGESTTASGGGIVVVQTPRLDRDGRVRVVDLRTVPIPPLRLPPRVSPPDSAVPLPPARLPVPPRRRADPTVPDLVGTDSTTAKLALNRLGLVGRVDLVRASGRPGIVFDVVPPAGEPVPPGTQIRLLVADGLPPVSIPVPPLTGLDTARARAVLDSLGLPWRAVPAPIIGPPGRVVSVDPAEGTPFRPLTTSDPDQPGLPTATADSVPPPPVIVVGIPDSVSQRVPVPSLIGLDTTRAEARALDSLTSLGPVDRSFTFSFRESGGVARQTPEPGTLVPPGTPIAVRLAWRWVSILIVVTGIAFLLALPLFFLFVLRPRKLRTVRHADPHPHIATDPKDPRDGPDIRNRPVLDPGKPSFSDDDPPTIVNERRFSDD